MMAINGSSVLMPVLFGSIGTVVGVSALFWAVGCHGGRRSAAAMAAGQKKIYPRRGPATTQQQLAVWCGVVGKKNGRKLVCQAWLGWRIQ